jgi:hypothetical protein
MERNATGVNRISWRIVLYGRGDVQLQCLLSSFHSQEILQSIREGNSSETLCANVDALKQLEDYELIYRREKGYVLSEKIIFIDRSQERLWEHRAEELVQHYLSIVRQEITKVVESFEKTSVHIEQGYRWEELSFMIVAGLLMDLGVGDALRRQGVIQHSPEDHWLWCFGGQAENEKEKSFGVKSWRNHATRSGVVEVWHASLNTGLSLLLNTADIRFLYQAAQRDTHPLQGDPDMRKRILKLRAFRLIKPLTHELNIPILTPNDLELLLKPLEDIAGEIVRHAILPGLVKIHFPKCQSKTQTDAYRMAFCRLVMEAAFGQAVASGLITSRSAWTHPCYRRLFWWEKEKQIRGLGQWLNL